MSLILTLGMGTQKESIAPLVLNVTPAAGTPINAADPLQLDVTDETGLAIVLITASYPNSQAVEVVFDGTDFTDLYTDDSSVEVVTDGFRFVLLRRGGWIGPPTLTPYALDTSGNIDA